MAAMHRHLMRSMDKMCALESLTANEKSDLCRLQTVLNRMLGEYLKRANQMQDERRRELMLLNPDMLAADGAADSVVDLANHSFSATALYKTTIALGMQDNELKAMAEAEGAKSQ